MSEKEKMLVVLVKAVRVDQVSISRLTRSDTSRIGDPGEPDGPRSNDEYEVSIGGRDAKKYAGGVPLSKLSERVWKTALGAQRRDPISERTQAACALIDAPAGAPPAAPDLPEEN